MNFIIYQDGTFVTRDNLEDAFALPGNTFIFSMGKFHLMDRDDGVCFYNRQREKTVCKIGYLEFIDIKSIGSNEFSAILYDHLSDSGRTLRLRTGVIGRALGESIKTMVEASQCQNWEVYEKIKMTDEYIQEIKRQKDQIEALEKRNALLSEKLKELEKVQQK